MINNGAQVLILIHSLNNYLINSNRLQWKGLLTVGGAIKLWQIIIIAYNRNAISIAYKHYECVCLFLYAWMVTQSKRYILCTVSVWVILCFIVLVQCSFPVLSHYLSHYCIYCLFILPVLFSSLSCS